MMESNKKTKKYRPEIEGVRAVAALLVAIYHIWVGNVSGGVDVFFVVSGFLITTSLLSRFERNNEVGYVDFLTGLSKRLFPTAFFVMVIVAIASIIWLPKVRWDQTVSETFASAFYYQNWELAINAVDYLAQNNEASPFQHYWALSIQGQFYLLWPMLLLISIFIARKVINKSVRATLLGTFIVVFLLSLSYSMYKTTVNQPWAYYDTFARVWEFSLGGMLALIITYITLRKSLSFFLGWLGLLAIISTGIVFQVSTSFPGYAALVPTLGAAAVMIASSNGGTFGVHRILSSKPMLFFGSFSYAFYLWHWPVLIFYFILTGFETVSLFHGIGILLLSVVLSYLTTRFIEKPLRLGSYFKNKARVGTIVRSAALMVPVIITASVWMYVINQSHQELSNFADEDYPGGMVYYDEVTYSDDLPVRPSPMQSRNDRAKIYPDNCHQDTDDATVIECEYGVDSSPDYTVALVGGSHSGHWLDALEAIAETENLKIYSYTKSECRFALQTGTDEDPSESCLEWSENVLEVLDELNPDIIVTTADIGQEAPNNEVPEGFLAMWDRLNEDGIPVFAIRDNPWMDFDVPTCVEDNGRDSEDCIVDRDEVLSETSAWDKLESEPENVHYVDFSDYFCEEDVCKSVVGNVLVYRDSHHITGTFARSISPVFREELMEALN